MGEEQYCIVTLNSTFYSLTFVQLAFSFAIYLSFRLFSSNELVANMLGQPYLRTRAPAYSRALRRIIGVFPKGRQEKLRSYFRGAKRGQSSC